MSEFCKCIDAQFKVNVIGYSNAYRYKDHPQTFVRILIAISLRHNSASDNDLVRELRNLPDIRFAIVQFREMADDSIQKDAEYAPMNIVNIKWPSHIRYFPEYSYEKVILFASDLCNDVREHHRNVLSDQQKRKDDHYKETTSGRNKNKTNEFNKKYMELLKLVLSIECHFKLSDCSGSDAAKTYRGNAVYTYMWVQLW